MCPCTHGVCVCVGGNNATDICYKNDFENINLSVGGSHCITWFLWNIQTRQTYRNSVAAAARGWEAGKKGEGVLNRLFPLRVMKVFGNQIIVLVTEHCEWAQGWTAYVKMAEGWFYMLGTSCLLQKEKKKQTKKELFYVNVIWHHSTPKLWKCRRV